MGEISPALYRAGEGQPLVLLHGFTGAWMHWRPVLGELAAQFEVIAPTLHGHDGGSRYPLERGLTLRVAADLLEEHLDELGVEQAHIAGNSMGGTLAIELARRGRARSAVALSPGGGWELDSAEPQRITRWFVRQDRLLRASRRRIPAVMRTPGRRRLALRDVMRHGELVPADEAIALATHARNCAVFGEVVGALRSGTDSVPLDLGEIRAPVLLAWAQHDRVLPMATCSSRYRREIPGAEWRVLPDVGHVPMWDDPGLIARTIAGWALREAELPQPGIA